MAYAKVDVNTNPIPATILDAVPLTFPSGGGGGGGGGGGPVNLVVGGSNSGGIHSGAGLALAPGATGALAPFAMTYLGGRQALAQMVCEWASAGPNPYAGLNSHLVGSLTFTLDTGVGAPLAWTVLAAQLGPVVRMRLHGPTVALVGYPVILSVTNALIWVLDEAPFGNTPIAAVAGALDAVVMEL